MAQFFGSHGRLFERQAQLYAAYRPSYPPGLYEAILSFARLDHFQLALDIGTGSGQVAAQLAQTFARVMGLDASAEQISHATQLPNLEYFVAPAERVPPAAAAAGSVDLATVAQAFHWMDPRAFYSEMRRVLKPSGALAIWGYDLARFPPQQAAANGLLRTLYKDTLGPYWDARRGLVDAHYRGLEPSSREFGVVERAELEMGRSMPLEALMGYLSTWSAYQAYLQAHPGEEDPLVAFKGQLQKALLAGGADLGSIEVCWPLFLIMARQPAPLQ